MHTVEEAAAIIERNLPNFGNFDCLISSPILSELEQLVQSDREYPPTNRALMDGLAIKFEEYKNGRRKFKILGSIAAGQTSPSLTEDDGCYEIMTGAPVPDGSDLIIPLEHIKILQKSARIILEAEYRIYENIHLKGSDCKKDETILSEGFEMNGPAWGIAASMGYSKVKVKRKPRILIVSTGNELLEVNEYPEVFQLRRSNVYAMKASLLANGYSDITTDHLADDPEAIKQHYQRYSPAYDIMIYSGGVSKGRFDYLPEMWSEMGVKKYVHGVSQRPGKPMWFGVDEKIKTSVFGLPGNPISSLVCLHRYIIRGKKVFAKLAEEFTYSEDLTYFLPVKVSFESDASLIAHPVKVKNSGEFTALAGTDGFVELPRDKSEFSAGDVLPYFPWRSF